MDASVYALIGALGGVVITQAANYFLEEKRTKHRLDEESLNRRRALASEVRNKRHEIYSQSLAELDYWYALEKTDRAEHMLKHFYSASVIASDEVAGALADLLRSMQDNSIKPADVKQKKGDVLRLMRKEVTGDSQAAI